MSAPREILDLVARFEQQLDAYKSGQYNETQLRREFLDPFFKALGWDIDIMLVLHSKFAAARTPQEKTALERQIAATDTQIDALVYELYGLTKEEIALVEGAGK